MLVSVIIGLWIREFLLTQPVTWNTLLTNGSYRPCGKKEHILLIGLNPLDITRKGTHMILIVKASII